MALKRLFRSWQHLHPNFMTPYVVDLIENGNIIIEISEGTGFNHEPIYGVTAFHYTSTGFKNTGEGQMFTSLTEARKYANMINGRYI